MTQATRRITYRGDPAGASLLADLLQREGVTVQRERQDEQRGVAEIGQAVVVAMVVKGTDLAINVAVAKFRKHMHGRAEASATIENEQDEELEE